MGEAFHGPARTLRANVIPAAVFENAASWLNGVWAAGVDCRAGPGRSDRGPRGGARRLPYLLNALGEVMRMLVIGGIRRRPPRHAIPLLTRQRRGRAGVARYVGEHPLSWRTPVLFAALLTLDLFSLSCLVVWRRVAPRVLRGTCSRDRADGPGPTSAGSGPGGRGLGMALFLAHRFRACGMPGASSSRRRWVWPGHDWLHGLSRVFLGSRSLLLLEPGPRGLRTPLARRSVRCSC